MSLAIAFARRLEISLLPCRARNQHALIASKLPQMVSLGLDADRSTLYCDLVLHSLPEAARRALQASTADLDQIAERVLTAKTLDEALGTG